MLTLYDVVVLAALVALVWDALVLLRQRNEARRALLGLVALLPNYNAWRDRWEWLCPGDLGDDEIRLRLARADAALCGEPPPSETQGEEPRP